jgi:hypothetical protein
MSYRPYPNADRALAQVARHRRAEVEVPPALQPVVASLARFRENARRVVEAWPEGEYRLSTLPRVVSGGS